MRAGKALECDGKPYAHGAGDYGGGLEEVQDDATAALEDYFDNEGWGGRWPDDGYRVEREGDDRVLLSWDVDQRTKVAFVVADGITDYLGHRGWGVETWAQCNAAELTEDELEDLGVQIWEDARRPPGPDDGDHLVPGRRALRLAGHHVPDARRRTEGTAVPPRRRRRARRPDPHDVRRLRDAAGRRPGHRVPARGPGALGDRDAAYLVELSDPADVERWPAPSKGPIFCA